MFLCGEIDQIMRKREEGHTTHHQQGFPGGEWPSRPESRRRMNSQLLRRLIIV